MQRTARGGGLQRLVDLLDARLARALDGQVDDRAGRHGRAHREAVQLALQLGDHEADRLGRAGRGRDQVDRGGARAAQVVVRHVLQALVGGVGVDRRHQAVLDADRVVEHLGHRRQAVGRARGVGDDVVLVAVVDLVEVDAEHDGHVRVGGRRGDDRPSWRRRARCLAAALAVGEQAGRLDHDVDAELAPRQRAGSRSASTFSSRAVDLERAVALLDGARVGAEDRVVLEQVRERRRVGEVVDRDPLDRRSAPPPGLGGAEHVAADAAESVDPHPYRHSVLLKRK